MKSDKRLSEKKEKSIKPLAPVFQVRVTSGLKLEENSFAGDTTTVSPDGCAWTDPWKG